MSADLTKKLTTIEQEQANIHSRTMALSNRVNEFESDTVSIEKFFWRDFLNLSCSINDTAIFYL